MRIAGRAPRRERASHSSRVSSSCAARGDRSWTRATSAGSTSGIVYLLEDPHPALDGLPGLPPELEAIAWKLFEVDDRGNPAATSACSTRACWRPIRPPRDAAAPLVQIARRDDRAVVRVARAL